MSVPESFGSRADPEIQDFVGRVTASISERYLDGALTSSLAAGELVAPDFAARIVGRAFLSSRRTLATQSSVGTVGRGSDQGAAL